MSQPSSQRDALPLLLRPKVHPTVTKFLANKKRVHDLISAFGSPLNIMFPSLLAGNIQTFQDVFAKHQLLGRIFFAHKTTRSDSLVKQLAVEKVSIDVASLNELQHALSCGFDGKRIEATGPKNAEFLSLCLLHSVVLNIDSVSELRQSVKIYKQLGLKREMRVLLRLSGFDTASTSSLRKSSRFGIPLEEIEDAFSLLSQNKKRVALLGFSFHLDTTSAEERVAALDSCFSLLEEAIDQGFYPKVLNIGGGFRINYLENEHDWSDYTAALKESVLGKRLPLTWQKATFGMSVENGMLRGNFNSYNFYEPAPGARFLDEILSQRLPARADVTVAEFLSSNMIELWIEPGRAIVDQCGVTVARVNSLRRATGGEQLVALNMKRSDLAFLDQEMFVDPLVLPKGRIDPSKASPVEVFFAGTLCLESDLIYRHATFLESPPRVGDLVVFINTAAYATDFSASQAIMQPTARKIAVTNKGSRFAWVADDVYSPFWQFYTQET